MKVEWNLVCSIIVGMSLSGSAFSGKIALTFDDVPLQSGGEMSVTEKADRIIQQLKSRNVDEALFFVTGKNIDENSRPVLSAYDDAGFYLGNHSFEHESANKMSVDDFLADASKTHSVLQPYDHVLPYYRFPYLHSGDSKESRAAIAKGLKNLGYSNGYVTVDNYDWYINHLYVQYVNDGNKINYENLEKLYVDLLWENIQFYEALAQKVLGRSPKHVLLLHENDLAALYLGALIDRLRSEGWKIISSVEAYKDPLAKVDHDLPFSKQGRVAAVAHSTGFGEHLLRHENENADYIKRMFDHYEVVGKQEL